MQGCISLYSYIKPQPEFRIHDSEFAVYPYIPTSNRNVGGNANNGSQAVYPYIPTSNRNSSIPFDLNVTLYILIFLHQTATSGEYDGGDDAVYPYIPTSNRN